MLKVKENKPKHFFIPNLYHIFDVLINHKHINIMPHIKTTQHQNGTFTFESNGIAKTYRGCLKSAKKDFICQLNYLLK